MNIDPLSLYKLAAQHHKNRFPEEDEPVDLKRAVRNAAIHLQTTSTNGDIGRLLADDVYMEYLLGPMELDPPTRLEADRCTHAVRDALHELFSMQE